MVVWVNRLLTSQSDVYLLGLWHSKFGTENRCCKSR